MVLMLVAQDDGVDGARIDAEGLQPLGRLARAEAGVDEHGAAPALDQRGVAGAARSQDAEAHVAPIIVEGTARQDRERRGAMLSSPPWPRQRARSGVSPRRGA